MVFLVITVLSILFLCSVFGRGFMRLVYLSNKIRGPSLWKFLTFHAKPLCGDDMIMHLWRICESYNYQPWGAWLYGQFAVIISDWASVNEVCQNKNTSNKPNFFHQNIAKYLGNGLITINGADFRLHKKIVSPGFRKNILEAKLLSHTNEQAIKLIQKLHQKTTGDFYPSNFIQEEIIDTVFWALCVDYYKYPDPQRLIKMANLIKELVQLQSMNPLYYWLVHKLKPSTRKTEEAIKKFFDDIKKDIKDTAQRFLQDEANADWQPSSVFEFLLKGMIEMGELFNEEDLISEVQTLAIAAFDTNAVAMNMALLMLALHPAVQERIFEEMESIFGHSDRPVEPQDLSRMVYLEAFIKETLRMFPPLSMVLRDVDDDINLNDVLVPKGSVVLIDTMALHRNPQIYEDPVTFLPDRFLPKNEERPPMAYIPFGFGARLCPGFMVAYIVLKTMISHVVRNFIIVPGDGFNSMDDIKIKMSVSLKLCKPLPIRVVSRATIPPEG